MDNNTALAIIAKAGHLSRYRAMLQEKHHLFIEIEANSGGDNSSSSLLESLIRDLDEDIESCHTRLRFCSEVRHHKE